MTVKVKKPRAILFAASSIMAKNTFMDKTLLPYLRTHGKTYLEANWQLVAVQDAVARVRIEAEAIPDAPAIPAKSADKDEQLVAISNYINYCTDKKVEPPAYGALRYLIWYDGLEKGRLEMPVYTDVAIQIQKWRCDQHIQLYVLSSHGSTTDSTRHFLAKTNMGNLNHLIVGYFDASLGSPIIPATYVKMLAELKTSAGINSPDELLFLTRCAEEARASKAAGITVVQVLAQRRPTGGGSCEAATGAGHGSPVIQISEAIPQVRSFNEIEFKATGD